MSSYPLLTPQTWTGAWIDGPQFSTFTGTGGDYNRFFSTVGVNSNVCYGSGAVDNVTTIATDSVWQLLGLGALTLVFDRAVKCMDYEMWNNANGVHSTDWNIYGSNDNIKWDLIDSRTGQGMVIGTSFTLLKPNFYTRYKFEITGVFDGYSTITEVKMYGLDTVVTDGFKRIEYHTLKNNHLQSIQHSAIGDYTQDHTAPISDITPVMTSNSAPSPYVVSASSEYNATYAAWKAMDSVLGDPYLWISGTGVPVPHWWKIDYGSPLHIITGYKIIGYTDDYYPSEWYFQGSVDDINWVNLDYQQFSYSHYRQRPFFAKNNVKYRYYRFYITGVYNVNADGRARVDEIKLYTSRNVNYNNIGLISNTPVKLLGTDKIVSGNSVNSTWVLYKSFVCTRSGLLTHFRPYAWTNTNVKLVLYSNNSTAPGVILTQTTGSITSGGRPLTPTSPVKLVIGTTYWLAIQGSVDNAVAYFSGVGSTYYGSLSYANPFVDNPTGLTAIPDSEITIAAYGV